MGIYHTAVKNETFSMLPKLKNSRTINDSFCNCSSCRCIDCICKINGSKTWTFFVFVLHNWYKIKILRTIAWTTINVDFLLKWISNTQFNAETKHNSEFNFLDSNFIIKTSSTLLIIWYHYKIQISILDWKLFHL